MRKGGAKSKYLGRAKERWGRSSEAMTVRVANAMSSEKGKQEFKEGAKGWR